MIEWQVVVMRIDLSTLTSEQLSIEWPGAQGTQRIVLSGAAGLRGSFETLHSGYKVSNARCTQIGVGTLALRFGSVVVALSHDGQLDEVAAELEKSTAFALTMSAAGLRTGALQLTVGSMEVTAQLEGEGVQLHIQAGDGALTATRCVLRALKLETGGVAVMSDEVALDALDVRWGAAGFSARAARVASAALALNHPRLFGKLFGVGIEGLTLARRAVQVAEARVQRAELGATVPPPVDPELAAQSERDDARKAAAPPLFELCMLDGLSGNIDVDVALELGVPIIGRRRATHKLRVPVADGAINYRELERDLAALEDSLLDFSVRDGALVLELGLPLVVPRGFGKPLLVWPLGPADLALAEAQRVRLCVLPKVQPAGDGEESSTRERPSKFQLRTMSFQNIDAALALAPPSSAESSVVRSLSFAQLRVTGDVHHEAGPPDPEGKIQVEVEQLAAAIADLLFGRVRASATVSIAALRNVVVDFRDLRPAEVHGNVEGFALRALELALG